MQDKEIKSRQEYICEDENSFSQVIANLHSKYGKTNPCIFLSGDLGAGKTTFSRYWLRNEGVEGIISSPSYAVVNSYDNLKNGTAYHFDCYRLSSFFELVDLGIEEYKLNATWLVEWPEKAMIDYRKPDIWVSIDFSNASKNARKLNVDFYLDL